MSGLLLCGKTAVRPFYVKEADINLYSMEELCYFIYNNVYMIGEDFFDDSLLVFIDRELELSNVAKKLKDQRFMQEPVANMIKTVFDGCYYYSDAEKESILTALSGLENKSFEERLKARADMMAERGRINKAMELYKKVIAKISGIKNAKLLACTKNNLGVVYAKQFLFKDALECFREAYDTDKDDEYMDNLICTAILLKDEKCFDDIMKQYEITDETIERYNQAIKLAEKEIYSDEKVSETMEKLTYTGDMELSEYYRQCDSVTDIWKKEYREQIQ